MAGEIAFDVTNNSLYGDLYKKGKTPNSKKYRMGNLKLDTANGIGWEVFNLTENCPGTVSLEDLKDMYKTSKSNLSDEEKKNLERLIQQPRE